MFVAGLLRATLQETLRCTEDECSLLSAVSTDLLPTAFTLGEVTKPVA